MFEHETVPAACRPGESVDDVVHEHIVTGLLAVAEDHALASRDEVAGKDRHDPGLPVRVLCGP